MANKIKILRQQAGLSQQALADMTGTTKQQIGRLESGSRQLTEMWQRKLAKALSCHPADILADEDSDSDCDETALLSFYRKLNAEDKSFILRQIKAMAMHKDE